MVTGGQFGKCHWNAHWERWQANTSKQSTIYRKFLLSSFSFSFLCASYGNVLLRGSNHIWEWSEIIELKITHVNRVKLAWGVFILSTNLQTQCLLKRDLNLKISKHLDILTWHAVSLFWQKTLTCWSPYIQNSAFCFTW
jgi:hypothetical protein